MSANDKLSVDELEKKEEEEFRTGPLSVLTTSVKTNSQVRQCRPRRLQSALFYATQWPVAVSLAARQNQMLLHTATPIWED